MPVCACGCGEGTEGGTFRPGHDSKLRAEAERRAGGVISLAKLVDAAAAFVDGSATLDEFGARIKQLMARSKLPVV